MEKIEQGTNRVSLFFRLINQRGISNTLLMTLSYFIDFLFDVRYGTDTSAFVTLEDLGVENMNLAHAEMYQPTHTIPLKKLFKTLQLNPGKILVDFGCGKGRVLLVASEFDFKEVRGIEFSPHLCSIAEKNCSTFSSKSRTNTNFKVILSDVANYEIQDDETVFFLFNPFDKPVLSKVLHNISNSYTRSSRKIMIIYRKALHREIVKEIIKPTDVKDFTFWGFDFVVFELDPEATSNQMQGA